MMPVFQTDIGNLGGLMCWEHQVPLDLMAMNAQNEQVHVASGQVILTMKFQADIMPSRHRHLC